MVGMVSFDLGTGDKSRGQLLSTLASAAGVSEELLAESVVFLALVRTAATKEFLAEEEGGFKISIDDGFVEYSYNWKLPSSWSIETVAKEISMRIGAPIGEGTIREKVMGGGGGQSTKLP